MKFAVVIVGLLSLASTWAAEKKPDEPKDKREAPVGYPSSGHSSHTLQIQPSIGHDDGQAISIGAGYSVGGAKPSISYGAPSASYLTSQQHGGHSTIQLPPITLQPEHGGAISSSDLSQLMSQLSHGFSSGAISLQSAVPSYQGGAQLYQGAQQSYQGAQQSYHGGPQEASIPQLSYGAPKQQYTFAQLQSSGPSYSTASKGLGSYSSTGPVLFSPSSDAQSNQALNYAAAPSSGHSFANSLAALSLENTDAHSSAGSGGYSLAGLAHSLGSASGHGLGSSSGYSLGGLSGHSLEGAGAHSLGGFGGYSMGGQGGHSLGAQGGHSLEGSSHSFGGQYVSGGGHSSGAPIKSLSGSYGAPSKTSFKPSAFLGSSLSDSAHSLSGPSGSYGAPSFGNAFSGGHSHGGLSLSSLSSSGHGPSYGGSFNGFGSGSSKFGAQSYLPPKTSFGSSLDSNVALSSAGHGHGHSSSPLGTTYGVPSGSYLPSSSAHGSSSSPQYYISSSKHPSQSSFGEGSSSYRAPYSHGSHGSLSSFSSSPKYSFGSSSHSAPSSRYGPSKDIQGAYSETSYNTIKYSEELKPHTR